MPKYVQLGLSKRVVEGSSLTTAADDGFGNIWHLNVLAKSHISDSSPL